MKLSVNAPCPCGSGGKFKRCCAVYHRGRPAEPEALMRARYSAYATGNVRFLIATTDREGPHYVDDVRRWRQELAEYCKSTRFLGLKVHRSDIDDAAGRGTVTFTADLERDGSPAQLTECSTFVRSAAGWKYHAGVDADAT